MRSLPLISCGGESCSGVVFARTCQAKLESSGGRLEAISRAAETASRSGARGWARRGLRRWSGFEASWRSWGRASRIHAMVSISELDILSRLQSCRVDFR